MFLCIHLGTVINELCLAILFSRLVLFHFSQFLGTRLKIYFEAFGDYPLLVV